MSRKIIDNKTQFGRFKQIARHYPEIMPLISEGDSWYSYPLAGNNIMDNLLFKFAGTINYFRLESSGHLATEMFRDCKRDQLKLLAKLVKQFRVPIVLISAGGNDVVGVSTGGLLRRAAAPDDVDGVLDSPKLDERMGMVKTAYNTMIQCLLNANPTVRIVAHTYDYPIVSGAHAPITVNSLGVAAPLINLFTQIGPWLKPHLIDAGLTDAAAQQAFSIRLIDRFHDRVLMPLRNAHPAFEFVDLRDTLQLQPDMWNDEIHPSTEGFARLAEKYWTHLQPVLQSCYHTWLNP